MIAFLDHRTIGIKPSGRKKIPMVDHHRDNPPPL